jgi:hypothetical protein
VTSNYRLIGMLPLNNLKKLRHAWVDQTSPDDPTARPAVGNGVGEEQPTPSVRAEDDKPGGNIDMTLNEVGPTFARPCVTGTMSQVEGIG